MFCCAFHSGAQSAKCNQRQSRARCDLATTTLLSSPQSPCFDDTSLTERTRTNDQKTGFIKLSVLLYFCKRIFLHNCFFCIQFCLFSRLRLLISMRMRVGLVRGRLGYEDWIVRYMEEYGETGLSDKRLELYVATAHYCTPCV